MCADRMLRGALALALLAGLALPSAAAEATPTIQSWETRNGARVLFVEAPELPILDVRVIFDAASSRDDGHPGLANLTGTLLLAGAGPWDADALARRLENVGAEMSSGVLRDMAWVSARTLTAEKPLNVTVETLAAVLAKPHVSPRDLERIRAGVQVSLRQDEQSPGEIAEKAFYRALYGDDPYAGDPKGTAASVAAITRDEILAFYKRHYVARNAVVALVGALDRAQAEQLAERITAGLPAGEHAGPLPKIPEPTKARLDRIAFPSTQTHIYVGEPGMSRTDPDYFPLFVGNHILGGNGLVSLLADEVRQKRGLSYSVYSAFVPMRRRGPFLMVAQTRNDQAPEALSVMRATLTHFIDEGPTATQLEAAKENITGGFPLNIASNKDIVQYLAMIGFYGLPLDYLSTLVDKVNAVTAEQVRDAFARRVDPTRLLTVVVGGEAEPASASL